MIRKIIKKLLSRLYLIGKREYEYDRKNDYIKTFKRYANFESTTLFSVNYKFNSYIEAINTKCINIGENTLLDCTINYGGGKLNIGDNCSFRIGTIISCKNKISIGNNVFGATNVFISDNNNHPTDPVLRKEMTKVAPGNIEWKTNRLDVDSAPIIIEDNVWIGKDCFILKGVRIGEGAIIAANSVVTKNVKSNSIIGGNPAKVIKEKLNE